MEAYTGSEKLAWNAKDYKTADDDYMTFEAIEISQDGEVTSVIQNSKEVAISITYRVKRQVNALQLSVDLVDNFDNVVFKSFQYEQRGSMLRAWFSLEIFYQRL